MGWSGSLCETPTMHAERSLEHGCALWRSRGADAETIPADGCVDVIVRDDELWLAGPSTRSIRTWPDGAGETLGLRYAPGLASHALGLDLSEVRDAHAPLQDVVGAGRARRLARALRAQAAAPGTRGVAAELLPAHAVGDGGWTSVVRRAAVDGGDAVTVARELGWSARHLRRRTASAFGYGFGSLVRIERARRARALIEGGVGLAAAAVEAGYADQAHMTREFARLVGRTPGQVAGSAAKRSIELPSGSSSVA